MSTPAELSGLLTSVARGDEAAFASLYQATAAKIFGVVLRILGRQDLAEDVLHETYLKIWSTAGQFNPDITSAMTWMVTIARHRALDLVRKGAASPAKDQQDNHEASEAPIQLARSEMTDELKQVLECVGQLEPVRQKLVLLAYYNGWSRDQLAAKFGETPVTVKGWLRQALLDSRSCLGLA